MGGFCNRIPSEWLCGFYRFWHCVIRMYWHHNNYSYLQLPWIIQYLLVLPHHTVAA
jgi:hypothetical protein